MTNSRTQHKPSHDKRLLESFSTAFAVELDLIKAVAELLRRMRREGVEILHGPQEYGKDIIFYAPGGFHEQRLFACVVKNHKLTGGMDSDAGTRTVFHQAETAFDTPYTNLKGIEEHVESVYVITPHECSQSAMFAIREKLKARSGQVTFLAGPTLLDLFLDYWPDFVLFDSGALTKYLSGLPAVFATDTAFAALVRRYALLSDTVKPLTQVYVQRDFREVLLSYTISALSKPPSLDLDKRLRQDELKKFINALSQYADPLEKALSCIGSNQNAFVDAVQEVGHALEQRWQSIFHNVYIPQARREREEYITRKRKAHERQHVKSKNAPPFVPPTEEELRREGIGELPQDHAQLVLDSKSQVAEQMNGVMRSFEAAISNIMETLGFSNSFVTDVLDTFPNIDVPMGGPYRSAQSLALAAPSLVDSQITSKQIHFNKGFLSSGPKALLITGPAGFGKTSFCKWHTLQDAQAFLDGVDRVLPIYIPLHQIHPKDDDTFENVFTHRDDLREILADGGKSADLKIRLYLDGLDEVPDSSRQQLIIRLARDGAIRKTNLRIIATAREHVAGTWLGWLARVKISNLSEGQIEELVSKWLDCDEEKIMKFFDQLAVLPKLKQLMGVPLLGTLVIAVYRRTGAIPQSRVELYRLFVELHCGGWDLVKDVHRDSRFGSNDKELVLSRFGARLHYAKSRDGDLSDFAKCVKETLPGFVKDSEKLLAEILEDGLLTGVGSRLMFSHLSFQEFMTARYLAEPEGHSANSVLKTFLRGDDWWKDVLAFYVGLYSRPKVMAKWLEKAKIKISTQAGRSEQSEIENRFRYLMDSIQSVYPASVG